MKKVLLLSVLAVFVFGTVACGGGGDAKALADEMIKITEDYCATMEKVDNKDDLIKAMKDYYGKLGEITKKGNAIKEKDPKATAELGKEYAGKMMELQQKIQKAMQRPEILKLMADPDVQKAMQESMKGMMK